MSAPVAGDARTVYVAKWVLPITAPPISHGAVAIEGTKIAFVGSARALPETWASATRVELGDVALLPGLVNTHTHLELTAMRGFLEGLPFAQWLSVLTRARAECFAPESLYDSARAGIAEALRNGITTCADTTESGAPIDAMRDMGMRGIGFLEVFGPDPAKASAAISTVQARAAALRARDTALVRTGISPHAPYTVSRQLFRAVAELARLEQWPLAVHVAESLDETRFVADGSGPFAERLRARGIVVSPLARSPIALLDECGVLARQPLLIHAIQLDHDDIARIADSGSRVAHCPISNLKLGHGIAPLQRLREADIAVGLGTDSVASNDRMDLLGEARQAALLYATQSGVPDALTAHQALELATIGGACALGLADQVGSLEQGKSADLAAFAIDHPDAQPFYDPAVTLVHVLAGAATAALVVVAGREMVRHGKIVNRDNALHVRMEALGARLRVWRAVNLPA